MNCIHHGLSLHLAYLQLKLNLCRFDLIQTGFHQPYVKKTTTDILSESTTKNLKKLGLSTIDIHTIHSGDLKKLGHNEDRHPPSFQVFVQIHTRHCHTFYH